MWVWACLGAGVSGDVNGYVGAGGCAGVDVGAWVSVSVSVWVCGRAIVWMWVWFVFDI